jgi:glycosyltransferase involved in cell wall biosynthesis
LILFIDQGFSYPFRGGASFDIFYLLSELHKQGRHIHLLIPHPERRSYWGDGSFKVDDLPFPYTDLEIKEDVGKTIEFVRVLREAIASFKPDKVLIGDSYFQKPLIAKACMELSIPYILRFYTYENMCFLYNNRFLYDKITNCKFDYLSNSYACTYCFLKMNYKYPHKDLFREHFFLTNAYHVPKYSKLNKEMLRNAAGIIVYNPLQKALLKDLNKNIKLIPTGTMLNEITPLPDTKPRILLFSGRIEDKAKGFDTLIQELDKVYRKRQDFALEITGTSDIKRPYLKELGWLDRHELDEAFKRAYLVLAPSLWQEAFGIGVIEAMSHGRAVLATPVEGHRITIAHNETGILAEIGAFASSIDRLLDAREELSKLGENAYNSIRERFTWEKISLEYSFLFERGKND